MKRKIISLPEDLEKLLVEEATRKGYTFNALIRQILWTWVENKENNK